MKIETCWNQRREHGTFKALQNFIGSLKEHHFWWEKVEKNMSSHFYLLSLHHLSELTNFYQPIVVITAQVTFICRCYMKAIRFFWRTLQLYPYHTCDIAFRCKVSRFRCKTLINCRGVSCNLSLKSPFWKVHLWFIIFIIIISIWTILETAQYESWHCETYS